MDMLSQINPEQLLTAVGFISYLMWTNSQKDKRIRTLEGEVNQLYKEHIASVTDANKDLLEATRTFDRLVQARGNQNVVV